MNNVKEVTNQELLRKAAYDDEAFAVLYRKYEKLVYFVAYKMCQNESDAQDVVQETFIEIKRSLSDLRNPQYFRLWLYRIIDSKCKKLFRKNKYDLTDVDQDHIQNMIMEHKKQHLPENTLHFQNDQELLMHMIEELPYDQKFSIILYYYEQMTTLEIAEVLHIPEGTVKSRLSVARSSLKKKIIAYEHREHVKLNFHDLSGALMMAFASAMVEPMATVSLQPHAKGISKQSLINRMKTASLTTKVIVGVTAMVVTPVIGLATYSTLNNEQEPMVEMISQKQKNFPILTYKGKQITSEIEAYYTIKQHVCNQDIETLTQQERNELDPLVQALKKENSLFYTRLRDSGWSQLYEK